MEAFRARRGVRAALPLDLADPLGRIGRAEADLRTALPLDLADPLGRIGRAEADLRTALEAKQVEELSACLLVVTDRRPDKQPQVVMDDYGEVSVAPFVADLVDADTDESLKGSVATQPSSRTRAMIALTLRQAIRRSSATVEFGAWVTSQAQILSKSRVWSAPCRAHGIWATTTGSSSSSISTSSITVAWSTLSTRRHGSEPSTPSSFAPFSNLGQSKNVGGSRRWWRLFWSGDPRMDPTSREIDETCEPNRVGRSKYLPCKVRLQFFEGVLMPVMVHREAVAEVRGQPGKCDTERAGGAVRSTLRVKGEVAPVVGDVARPAVPVLVAPAGEPFAREHADRRGTDARERAALVVVRRGVAYDLVKGAGAEPARALEHLVDVSNPIREKRRL